MSQQYPPDQGQSQPSYPQQSYQQPPQQYPPQPQYYGDLRNQMPLPQVPRKHHRKWPFILGGILVLLILIIVIAAVASSGGGSSTGNTSSSSTTSNNTSSGSSTHSIGQTVTDGTWEVTINKISTSHGSDFDTPKAGNVFLVINVTLKNTDSSAQTASSLGMFALKDSSGQTYDQDIAYGGSPDGNVAAGGLLKGNVVYEVPKSVTSFTLQFVPGLDASQLVEWSIKE